jgi:hypothetical protein
MTRKPNTKASDLKALPELVAARPDHRRRYTQGR